MKAIIWIVILILIGWGIWWWVKNPTDDTAATQPAATAQGLGDYSSDTDTSASDGSDAGPYEDKG